VDVNEVGKVCLADAPPKRILHVGLDELTHFTKYQLPDRPIFGAGAMFRDTWPPSTYPNPSLANTQPRYAKYV